MTEPAGQIISGMDSLMREYMAVANNIANVSTAGYKRTISAFSANLSKQLANLDEASFRSSEVDAAQVLDFSQGQILSTGRSLDVALEGKGFLVLETPAGPVYTRAGSLDVNAMGQLVDSTGRLVAGENGPIVIPPDASVITIQISADGTLSAGDQAIGKLRVVEFPEAVQLEAAGFGCYRASDNAAAIPATNVKVRQGFQESSNVRMMDEVVSLMTLSRLYESHMNILRKQSDNSNAMLSVANG